jgi:hypothetical protein
VCLCSNAMNVAGSQNPPFSFYFGTDVVACCMAGGSYDGRSLGPTLLHAGSSSNFKAILCILCSLSEASKYSSSALNLKLFIFQIHSLPPSWS